MMGRFRGAPCLVALAVCAACGPPDAPMTEQSHAAAVEAWRAQHEESYTRQYVPLAGLFFLDQGRNTAGSDPASDVVLPDRVPASVGTFIVDGPTVRFEPSPEAHARLHGEPVTAPVVLSGDDAEEADEIIIANPASDRAGPPTADPARDVAFWVHVSGDRRGIRIRDPHGESALSFAGFRWFPIDARYRVIGRFVADEAPETVRIPNLSGDFDEYTTEGVVEFALEGRTVRLRPMTTRPNRFFFIFRDGTSGVETYEAARFLYADLAEDGTVVLDFNEAYNPPCAFNPYTTCPIPPRENRVSVRILAGERAYPDPPDLPL